MKLKDKRIAFGLTSTFYAFKNTIKEMKNIVLEGGEIIPIMPIDTYNTNSKYGKALDFIKDIENITKRKIINTEEEADKEETDIMIIAPCCGNHIAKLASSIYDTPVLISAKLHLRRNKPVLLRNNYKGRS